MTILRTTHDLPVKQTHDRAEQSYVDPVGPWCAVVSTPDISAAQSEQSFWAKVTKAKQLLQQRHPDQAKPLLCHAFQISTAPHRQIALYPLMSHTSAAQGNSALSTQFQHALRAQLSKHPRLATAWRYPGTIQTAQIIPPGPGSAYAPPGGGSVRRAHTQEHDNRVSVASQLHWHSLEHFAPQWLDPRPTQWMEQAAIVGIPPEQSARSMAALGIMAFAAGQQHAAHTWLDRSCTIDHTGGIGCQIAHTMQEPLHSKAMTNNHLLGQSGHPRTVHLLTTVWNALSQGQADRAQQALDALVQQPHNIADADAILFATWTLNAIHAPHSIPPLPPLNDLHLAPVAQFIRSTLQWDTHSTSDAHRTMAQQLSAVRSNPALIKFVLPLLRTVRGPEFVERLLMQSVVSAAPPAETATDNIESWRSAHNILLITQWWHTQAPDTKSYPAQKHFSNTVYRALFNTLNEYTAAMEHIATTETEQDHVRLYWKLALNGAKLSERYYPHNRSVIREGSRIRLEFASWVNDKKNDKSQHTLYTEATHNVDTLAHMVGIDRTTLYKTARANKNYVSLKTLLAPLPVNDAVEFGKAHTELYERYADALANPAAGKSDTFKKLRDVHLRLAQAALENAITKNPNDLNALLHWTWTSYQEAKRTGNFAKAAATIRRTGLTNLFRIYGYQYGKEYRTQLEQEKSTLENRIPTITDLEERSVAQQALSTTKAHLNSLKKNPYDPNEAKWLHEIAVQLPNNEQFRLAQIMRALIWAENETAWMYIVRPKNYTTAQHRLASVEQLLKVAASLPHDARGLRDLHHARGKYHYNRAMAISKNPHREVVKFYGKPTQQLNKSFDEINIGNAYIAESEGEPAITPHCKTMADRGFTIPLAAKTHARQAVAIYEGDVRPLENRVGWAQIPLAQNLILLGKYTKAKAILTSVLATIPKRDVRWRSEALWTLLKVNRLLTCETKEEADIQCDHAHEVTATFDQLRYVFSSNPDKLRHEFLPRLWAYANAERYFCKDAFYQRNVVTIVTESLDLSTMVH